MVQTKVCVCVCVCVCFDSLNDCSGPPPNCVAIEYRVGNKIQGYGPISLWHVFLACPFSDPHLTTNHSNIIRVSSRKIKWFRLVHLNWEFEERSPSHCQKKKSLLSDPHLFKSTFTRGLSFWGHKLFTMLTTVPWWVPCETSTTRSQSILTSLIVKFLSYLTDIQLGMLWFSWNSHFVGPKPMNFWRMLWLFIHSSLFSANAPYHSLYTWLLQIWLLYTCSSY
jgi:hypothetical protein